MSSSGRQITSSDITDLTIVDADVAAAANIAVSKLLHVGAGNVLKSNGAANVAGQVGTADIVAGAVTQVVIATITTFGPSTSSSTSGAATLAECSLSITTTGGDVLALFSGSFYHSTVSADVNVELKLDAAVRAGRVIRMPATNNIMECSIVEIIPAAAIPAGAHTVSITYFSPSGATTTANGTNRSFALLELKR